MISFIGSLERRINHGKIPRFLLQPYSTVTGAMLKKDISTH